MAEDNEEGTVREGHGVYQYKDGQKYIGEWHRGKMHGYGKLYYNDNQLRYEGQFEAGMFHGTGTEYAKETDPEREAQIDEEYVKVWDKNWIKYEGSYHHDQRHGAGKIYFKNGTWRGNFENGQPNGQGIYLSYKNHQSTKGTWADG